VLKNLHLTDILRRGLGRDPPQHFVRPKAPYFVLDDLAVRNRDAQPRGGALKGVFFPSSPGPIRHPSGHRVRARI
jgi:hypothetical protein